jgi:predicted ATPase/DNA-binding SARP family transcriptional activator
VEFRVLGRLEVEADGVDLTPVRPKQVTVLGLLLVRAGAVVSVDELVDALWGERPPETAHTALYGHISALRKRLGAERIETHPPGYLLRLGSEDEVDVRCFERMTADAYANGPLERAEQLREALALFRGEPLADFSFDSFARSEAQRLEELRLAALEERIEADLQLGRLAETLSELESLVVEHPLRERLYGQLMVALYRAGRQAEALQVFGEARRVLVDELGIEPSLALRRLERRILNQDAELAAPDVFAPVPRPAGASPSGIVTFLFARGADSLELVRTVVGQHGGTELEAAERLVLVSFARARDAVGAAVGIERVTQTSVRIGIHSAEATGADECLTAAGARSAASISSAAYEGQILISQTTRDLLHETPLDDAAIRDLGEHRLTDLGPAKRLFQLSAPGLAGTFPPPVGLDARPTNLPLQATPFIGREQEIRDVAALLTTLDTRLVTLTGPGGTGKTRLAAHAAAELLDEFTDGVYFVALAALADARLVLPTVARTLGLAEMPGVAIGDQLVRHLRGRRFLLVLDNAEHLLAAAPAITELATASTGVRVLVTSRVPLHLPAETTYAVAPLTTPAGVALFGSRARAARLDFDVTPANASAVAGICAALDGLPLAIELAAARVTVLPPSALLERLDHSLQLLTQRSPEVPARHRSLRAAIDWSYELLDPDEQTLFVRLAVFVGGCPLDSAESVCGDDLNVVDCLSGLVDASLVRLEGTDEEPRFAMLETIREYAAQLLDESDEADELRQRHTEHYLALAEEAEPNLIGIGSHAEWLDRLEREHNNLRAAMDWLEASGETDLALRLAAALWRFLDLRGHLAEGRRRLESALGADEHPTAARAKALSGAADMALTSGDVATGRRWAEQALELYRKLGDAWGTAFSLLMFAYAIGQEGDWPRAQQLYDESAQRFRELGDEHYAQRAARSHAWAYYEGGDLERARELLEDNLRQARASHDEYLEGVTLEQLAKIAVDEGRLEDAVSMLKESHRILRDLGDLLFIAATVCDFARILALAGKAGTAARVLSSSAVLLEKIGARPPWVVRINDAARTAIRAQLDEAAFADAWEQGQALTTDEAVALALAELP